MNAPLQTAHSFLGDGNFFFVVIFLLQIYD